MNWLNGCALI